MAYRVYVQDINGNPLMPTTRFRKVRLMLNSKKARVAKDKPFTIRLQYTIENPVVQELYGGIDGGRTNIGNAVIDGNGYTVYTDHVTTRNKEVHELMDDRKAHRNASRRGKRLCKKRRAKKNHTTTHKYDGAGRILPGYEKPVMLKDIVNKEARFNNRIAKYKKPTGKLNPTTRQLVQTHLNHVKQICEILPVNDWTIELNKFSFMEMEDGTVYGSDFQNGRLKGYASVEDYVSTQQNGTCAFCKKPIAECHHIIPKSKGGSDGPENRVGLCKTHHVEVQNGELTSEKLAGAKKKYAGTSAWNQAMPFVVEELIKLFGADHVHFCTGYETKEARNFYGIPKTHSNDAVCIAALGAEIDLKCNPCEPYEVMQFRRHDRSIIKCQHERTYKMATGKLDAKGKPEYVIVGKNRRKRMDQKYDSLENWYNKQTTIYGAARARQMLSTLQVVKSSRSYNNLKRLLPGTVLKHQGRRYILRGSLTNGKYYRMVDTGNANFSARDCKALYTKGLVYT